MEGWKGTEVDLWQVRDGLCAEGDGSAEGRLGKGPGLVSGVWRNHRYRVTEDFCFAAGSGNISKACGPGSPGEKGALGNETAGGDEKAESQTSADNKKLCVSVMLSQAI